MAKGSGTKEDPWQLTTPSGTSSYEMYRDESLDPPALVCTVGTTQLRYQLRCIDDLLIATAFGVGKTYSVTPSGLVTLINAKYAAQTCINDC